MKHSHKLAHMKAAVGYAQLSYARRLKVGCIIVTHDDLIVRGYNGTPPGWDNNCENEDLSASLPYVIHAEQNALDKMVRSVVSSVGASVFITHSPCLECAKRLLGAQVGAVYYQMRYRSDEGLDFLAKAGMYTEQL